MRRPSATELAALVDVSVAVAWVQNPKSERATIWLSNLHIGRPHSILWCNEEPAIADGHSLILMMRAMLGVPLALIANSI